MNRILDAIAEVAGLISQRGWAERNAGNISVDVTEEYAGAPECGAGTTIPARIPYRELAGRCYVVTATGARFRDIAKHPAEHLVVVRLAEDLSGYRMQPVSSQAGDRLTTSEFPSHLSIHAHLQRNSPEKKAVLHTHPDHLVALTHVPEFVSSERLTRLLWSMHPEMKVVMPDGVGVAPYRLPGSEDLAQVTAEALQKHRLVLWEKHGCVAVGRDVFEAFDLIDTAEKSARIYLMLRSAGFEPEGLSDAELAELERLQQLGK